MRSLLMTLFATFLFEKTNCFVDVRRNAFWLSQFDVCQKYPKGRLPWILHVREPDYGWKDHTARAVVALAVNDYFGNTWENASVLEDAKKMTLQLEVEISSALLWKRTNPIHDSDLALYIHALLATNKNPRNFHGIDLVAELLHRTKNVSKRVNPILLLALCNSHVIEYEDFIKIREISIRSNPDGVNHPDADSRIVQLKALAFKALACAIKYKPKLKPAFIDVMDIITNYLHKKYDENDGHFGNVYTTALAVQAFTAVPDPPSWWDESKSLEYLERESEIDVNLMKAYYIELALNARKYNFIRDLYKGVPNVASAPVRRNTYYVQYTIKKDHTSDVFPSLTLRVESGTNFYEIMKMASNFSAVFNFTAYMNQAGDPVVYAVSGIPNDVEENTFWRLCREYAVDHDGKTLIIDDIGESPAKFIPEENDHMVYRYSNVRCPVIPPY